MQLSDTFVLPADRQAVWDLLIDLERSGRCVPGVESVEALEGDAYRGSLKVRIGPITAHFRGLARLTEIEPPERLAAVIEAEDKSNASRLRATFRANLEEEGPDTRVSFSVDFGLGGRLARFGFAVVQSTAKKMTAEFASCIRKTFLDEGES